MFVLMIERSYLMIVISHYLRVVMLNSVALACDCVMSVTILMLNVVAREALFVVIINE